MAQKNPKPFLVLFVVMSGIFLSTMDSGMLNIALPSIIETFNIKLESAELVVSGYLLTITVTLVFWGHLADRIGRERIYLTGMLLFSGGSLLCFFAATFIELLASRIFQALGAAMMTASGPALIKLSFPARDLGRGLGLTGIATACGLLAGPYIGGKVIHYFSWRAIFLVTLPLSTMVLTTGAAQFLRKDSTEKPSGPFQFDWLGGMLWVFLGVLVMLILHRLDLFFKPYNALLIMLFFILSLILIYIERKTLNPILPLELVQHRFFWAAALTSMIAFATMFSVLVLMPFYCTYIKKMPLDDIGRLMMAVPASLILLSPLSGRLFDAIGSKILTTSGLAICCLSLLALAFLSEDSSTFMIVVFLGMLGAGQSVFLPPNSASVLSRVPKEYAGISSGILSTARNFGMMLGATLSIALFSSLFQHHSEGMMFSGIHSSLDQHTFILAWRGTFLILAACAFCGAALSVRRS